MVGVAEGVAVGSEVDGEVGGAEVVAATVGLLEAGLPDGDNVWHVTGNSASEGGEAPARTQTLPHVPTSVV